MALTVRSVGHGAQTAAAFAGLVTAAGVGHVVDVRSYPGSRRHPSGGRPWRNGSRRPAWPLL